MAAVYCYDGIPLRFLASLLITDALSSVYEISMGDTKGTKISTLILPF